MTREKSKTKTARGKAPAQMTVAEVLEKVNGVPLWVQFWLERYAGGDEYALEPFATHDTPSTREIARLVYDVLDTDSSVQHAETDDHHEATTDRPRFPAEARYFVEEWIFQITSGQTYAEPWSNPNMAVMALPYVLDMSAGEPIDTGKEPTLALLRTAIRSLTTKRERRAFLRDTDEADAEPEKGSDINRRAAFGLARVLADPRLPEETRRELESAVLSFAREGGVGTDHPALVRRAFLLACDNKPKHRMNVRMWNDARRRVLDLLASIAEKGGAE